MNTHLGLAHLLGAQTDAHWQELARSIGVNRQDLPWLIAVVVLAALAVLGTGVWLTLHTLAARRHKPCNDGTKLFLELCRAHQLDRASRRLLQRLANTHSLSQPALLFVEPERYDIVDQDRQWETHREKLLSLRDMLFACPTPTMNDDALSAAAQ